MKIGILGCGYVGQAAADYWKKNGHVVTASTRKTENIACLKQYADKVVLIKDSLEPLLEEQEALLFCVSPDKLEDYENTYLENARALKALAPTFAALTQIIYTSSTSVYGDHQGKWVEETSPLNSTHKLIEILIETEKTLLESRTTHKHVCVFRLGEIIGPGREVASRLKSRVGKPFPGTGENFTNFSHLSTIVKGLNCALENHLDGIYNLCEDLHLPRKELYDALCKELDLPRTLWDPSQFSHHAGNKRVSSAKIKQHFL